MDPPNATATLNQQSNSFDSEEVTIDTGDSLTVKRDAAAAGLEQKQVDSRDKRRKGIVPIKEQYLIKQEANDTIEPRPEQDEADDDAAEAFHHRDRQPTGNNSKPKRKEKASGQNKARQFGSSRDEVGLCSSRAMAPEFSPPECRFGDKCKFEHDLRNYLKLKRADLSTFGGLCPVYETKGKCNLGWKCRFVGSHSKEIERFDGRKELVIIENADKISQYPTAAGDDEYQPGVVNAISTDHKIQLTRRKFPTPKSDVYLPWLESMTQHPEDQGRKNRQEHNGRAHTNGNRNSSSPEPDPKTDVQDDRAQFFDTPLLPSEKRRLYFGPETPVLAPLTTQGNLPFRRLCRSLGASFTYSEMAMALPLIQGQKGEWALMKAHESDIQPPTFTSSSAFTGRPNIVYDYDQSQDLTFGAQIAASKPWQAIKATEILTSLLPQGLRVVDLNCGCPIDLVYREGAGSALMDSPNKLEKILRGMNSVSGSTPVTVKIRTGTRDKQPTAQKLINRLVLGGGEDSRGNPCGVAAITLHGRSRQQRYTRAADWEYITSTASVIDNLNESADSLTDTIHEPDERNLANGHGSGSNNNAKKKVFFLGNGDIYSHEHYNTHITHSKVDTCMIARGALVKPWLFEEIATNQYLDKSSTERLGYIEQFCRFGLEAWGSDEVGVGQTRRFLLEWLSFACRYVPVGMLEVLPPNLNDRPPRYRGRDELETLMASDNFRDWIKLSEMFLGPAHKDFRFEPKHKSNSYEAEG